MAQGLLKTTKPGTNVPEGGVIINDNFTELYALTATLSDYLLLAGGTMTGDITLAAGVDINMSTTSYMKGTGGFPINTVGFEGALGSLFTFNADLGLINTTGAGQVFSYQFNGTSKIAYEATHLSPIANVNYDLGQTGTTRRYNTIFLDGSIDLLAADIVTDTTTGTKIGTGTTQKFGFWNTTPVVQPSHIADPTGGGTVDSEARTAINSILAQLATTGLQAAS